MPIVNSQTGVAVLGNFFLSGPSGGRRIGTSIAALPENQYRRIVEAQERAILSRYGNGSGLSADEAVEAQAAIDNLQALREARTAFLAQQSAQDAAEASSETPAVETTSSPTDDPGQAAIDAFRKIMKMTPEERLFELLLKKRGLTKEEFEALPPDEREKILEEITEEIREKIEKKSASTGTTENQSAQAANGHAASAAHASGLQGTSPRIDANGAAAAVSQTEIRHLAEQRSPTGKVGFEDLLILATMGREKISALTGSEETAPKTPDEEEAG